MTFFETDRVLGKDKSDFRARRSGVDWVVILDKFRTIR